MLASESCHFYLPDGSPFYTVPRKTGPHKGEPRAVSLRHDRKLLMELGAGPGVTTVTGILAQPAIVHYKLQQLFWAIMGNRPKPGESAEDYYKRVLQISEEHRERRADEGTQLHTEIERFLRLRGEPIGNPRWSRHIDNIVNALLEYGINIHVGVPEHTFFHPLGYGGKIDWYDSDNPLVMDFKGKENKVKCEEAIQHSDGYITQIAAYREGLRLPRARGINVFVGCDENADVLIAEWTQSDMQTGWEIFEHLLAVWKLKNHYFPKQPTKS